MCKPVTAYMRKWIESINHVAEESESGGRLALNRLYKDEPEAEDYIRKIIPRDRRRTLVQLRCGCLSLEIETGRYRFPKIPLCERMCQLCKINVGNEIHF